VTHQAEQPLTISQKFQRCKLVGQQLTALAAESVTEWTT